ncbi:unnamed protein product, partial [Protopolystoma xenopodis]
LVENLVFCRPSHKQQQVESLLVEWIRQELGDTALVQNPSCVYSIPNRHSIEPLSLSSVIDVPKLEMEFVSLEEIRDEEIIDSTSESGEDSSDPQVSRISTGAKSYRGRGILAAISALRQLYNHPRLLSMSPTLISSLASSGGESLVRYPSRARHHHLICRF